MRESNQPCQYDHTILLAHGSRDPEWAAPFKELEKQLINDFPSVSVAFMELSTPNIDEAVQEASAKGAKRIAILPLFFATGKHLKFDVPAMLPPLQERFNVNIDLLPALGEQRQFRSMIKHLVGSLLSEHQQADIGEASQQEYR
ncbi:sirohydrochlorin chelatase [Hahella ganghwensis]|uniref:sirohydrochlorin chelatase n=1 Tax=Hahella ganghwensis TaxID=286420 RepID=UPI00036DEAB9|nr:CbiX/SirB N-terminal domain-containing protein [Hahella ganghwensis]